MGRIADRQDTDHLVASLGREVYLRLVNGRLERSIPAITHELVLLARDYESRHPGERIDTDTLVTIQMELTAGLKSLPPGTALDERMRTEFRGGPGRRILKDAFRRHVRSDQVVASWTRRAAPRVARRRDSRRHRLRGIRPAGRASSRDGPDPPEPEPPSLAVGNAGGAL